MEKDTKEALSGSGHRVGEGVQREFSVLLAEHQVLIVLWL